jgi:glutathione S-transferase
MKLYYSPGACSFAPHIVLRELGLAFELDRVKDRRTSSGDNFEAINPKGYVPTLQLDDGQLLTEASVIVQYLADRKPESKLAPPHGTFDRYRLQEWLNFISAEIHKSFSPFFKANTPEEYKKILKENLGKRLDLVSSRLVNEPYLLGQGFTVADAYLFTVLNWAPSRGIDLARWPAIKDYVDRINARPSVAAAREAEKSRS